MSEAKEEHITFLHTPLSTIFLTKLAKTTEKKGKHLTHGIP